MYLAQARPRLYLTQAKTSCVNAVECLHSTAIIIAIIITIIIVIIIAIIIDITFSNRLSDESAKILYPFKSQSSYRSKADFTEIVGLDFTQFQVNVRESPSW